MGAMKKYKIQTLNLGKSDELARIIVERLEKQYGKKAVAGLIKSAIIQTFQKKEDTKESMIQNLKKEHAESLTKVNIYSAKMRALDAQIEELNNE